MDKQLYVAVMEKNKIGVVCGEAVLQIEVWSDDTFVNFRVAASSDKEPVNLKVDEPYNERNERLKCVNFVFEKKGDEE
jgi:hypothetical protein